MQQEQHDLAAKAVVSSNLVVTCGQTSFLLMVYTAHCHTNK